MSKPLSKRNHYMESPDYTPDLGVELQHEYTKLIAVYHTLDGIAERVGCDAFYGALRILGAIIPRIEEIYEAIPE